MRARSVKPGLFKNELLGVADPLFTVIFEGLWCLADREGRLEDRPLRIHAEVNPYRDSASTVLALDWLVSRRFVVRYEHCGVRYLQVVEFRKHQQPHIREAPSKIQPPSDQQVAEARGEHGAGTGLAPLTPSSLTPDSGLLTADSGYTRNARVLDEHGASTVLNVPRETRSTAGVIDMGNNLTRTAEEIHGQMLDAWKDVDGVNSDAFVRWIQVAESRGKRLDARSRLTTAKWLSGFDQATQESVIAQSERMGWKNLRELEASGTVRNFPQRKTIDEDLKALDPDGAGYRELGI